MSSDIERALEQLRKVQEDLQVCDDEKDELYGKELTKIRGLVDSAVDDLGRAVIAFQLKSYPYFTNWLKELGRISRDVSKFGIRNDIKEIEPENGWKKFEPTGKFTATLVFKDGTCVHRDGKWSDGTMVYQPIEDEVKA